MAFDQSFKFSPLAKTFFVTCLGCSSRFSSLTSAFDSTLGITVFFGSSDPDVAFGTSFCCISGIFFWVAFSVSFFILEDVVKLNSL